MWVGSNPQRKGTVVSDPNQPSTDPAGLRGPGDPDAVESREAVEVHQPHAEPGRQGNIREEQLTQAAGTVPAAYVGSGAPEAEDKPEDAADTGMWDEET
ncbi:hypothetical protein ASPU41_03845 [Arthrobacter sp. U41]|nr:hypothetical protein ASPU41_03845 [Arthrobacter sp. U41]